MPNAKAAPSAPNVHHYARTVIAATLGALALMLVSASILLVWANRTLTDTNTYVATVEPVVHSAALQDYVAGKVADQMLAGVPIDELAGRLLPPDQQAVAPDRQRALVRAVIFDSVVQIIQSPRIQQAWADTNRRGHAALIRGLDNNSPQIAVDLSPLQEAVVAALQQSKLAPVAADLDTGAPGQAVIGLAGAPLERIHTGYRWLKTAPWLALLAALVLAVLSVWVSIHHAKTLRRMLVDVGLSSLVTAALLAFSSHASLPSADPAATKVALALVGTLLHGLQTALVVLGIVCLLGAAASKWYSHRHGG